MKNLLKYLFLFIVGGTAYYLVETLWRGHSHISMFALGGICFILLGLINEVLPWSLGLVWQSLIGAGIITVLELIAGLILNVWLGLGVWDYSALPLNFMGQICAGFTAIWIPLSAVGIVFDDYLRHEIFGEEKPRYNLFGFKNT